MKRNVLNVIMVGLFLVLMNYRFTSNGPHEIVGGLVFLLVFFHNGINSSWFQRIFKGRQNLYRFFLDVVNFLLLSSFLVSMVSGLFISQFLTPFLALRGSNTIWLHEIHRSSSYLCFIFIGIHLGFHWKALYFRFNSWLNRMFLYKRNQAMETVLKVCVLLYGLYVSFLYHIGSMILMEQNFILDEIPSAMRFFLDYLVLWGFYMSLTCYALNLLNKLKK